MHKRGQDEDYLLIVSGSLRRAPYLADWKVFKDYIRGFLKEQPGYANVMPGTIRGEMQGWCKLKDEEDVNNVYSVCSRQLMVHVFATSLSTGYYDLCRCNCNRFYSGMGDRNHSPGRSGIDVKAVNQTAGRTPKTHCNGLVMPVQPTYQYPSYYQVQTYTAPPTYTIPDPYAQPVYSHSSGGLPVNLSRGAVVTETRGIFIQGLNYVVGDTELHALLNGVGLVPEYARVHKDSRGSSKGVATAKFATKGQAEDAVSRLNGKVHVGKKITVRMDTNSTVVGSLEPLVVDGTNKNAYK